MVDFSDARKVLLGGGSPSSDTETHKQNNIVKSFIQQVLFLPPRPNVSFRSLEMSSSSCQVIRLPLSFFFSVLWLARPMVIFPALFAPLTIVFESVLCDERRADLHQNCSGMSLFTEGLFKGGT